MKNLAIVIGGSSGIGRAVIEKLKEDYYVVNMSRSNSNANSILHLSTDVCDIKSIENSFNFLKKFNNPVLMVYCAGFVEPQGILEMSDEDWNKTIDTNLNGAFYCTKQFIKLCCKDEARIIYIASTAGTRPQAGWSAYASSKAGLINFALTMSEELKSYNIKTYCISPGRCATKLRKKLAPNENQDIIMQPSEVADFIYYLAKYDNVLNGQNIIVKKDIIGGI
jgi:NAD(P)-dependent dehydrogenase (short-subunit alcohol dehydrogenase family)